MPPLALDGDPRLRKEIASLGGATRAKQPLANPRRFIGTSTTTLNCAGIQKLRANWVYLAGD